MPFIWTKEKLAEKASAEIKTVRENAIKHGAKEVEALCDEVLASRIPPKKPSQAKRAQADGPVIGYHLVCRPEEKGVTRNTDGTVWSGTWVVAEKQAERSMTTGAYVALHASHAEPSYLHGIIKAYRRSKREDAYAEGQEVKTPVGTDFLLELTDRSVEWQGRGTVERSYVYASDEKSTM
ncbi:MAG TPA: hypothetical protein VGF53_08130 [Pseudolabrys sp.]|jgi:hypothetical protein